MIMKKIFTLLMMFCAALGMQAQDKYVVAGASTLLGENWNADTEINVMTTADNGATYTLEKQGVKLQKGNNYEFKVVKVEGEGNKTWYGAGEDGNAGVSGPLRQPADGPLRAPGAPRAPDGPAPRPRPGAGPVAAGLDPESPDRVRQL